LNSKLGGILRRVGVLSAGQGIKAKLRGFRLFTDFASVAQLGLSVEPGSVTGSENLIVWLLGLGDTFRQSALEGSKTIGLIHLKRRRDWSKSLFLEVDCTVQNYCLNHTSLEKSKMALLIKSVHELP
jgi:hypothetical protein